MFKKVQGFFGLNEPENKEELTFDQLLDERIKFGKSQKLSIVALGILYFVEGIEMIILGFLQLLIQKEWNLSDGEISYLSLVVFLGIFGGALVAGKLSDNTGRRKSLLLGSIGVTISSFLSVYSPTYLYLLTSRACLGFFIGITSPNCVGYASEILPQDIRAKYFSAIVISFAFGELFGLGICYFVLKHMHFGSWRLILFVAALPTPFSVPAIYKFIHESPRFCLVVTNQKRRAVDIINNMIWTNEYPEYSIDQLTDDLKKRCQLTSDEKWRLEKWADNIYIKQREIKASYSELLSEKNKFITIIMGIAWFPCSMIYYGTSILLPTIISKYNEAQQEAYNNNHYSNYTYESDGEQNQYIDSLLDESHRDMIGIAFTVLAEIPAILVVFYLVENKKIGGRKNLIFVGHVISAICCFYCFIGNDINQLFYASVSIIRFCFTLILTIMYPLTSELYKTSIRVTALGLHNCVNRIGGILIGWVGFLGFSALGIFGPFIIFGIFNILVALTILQLKKDTTNMPLDIYQELMSYQGQQK